MPVTLHRSNRLEALADALAEIVRAPLGSPFSPERVVIPSRGMEVWLAKRLASRLGVWANPSFPFPRAMVEAVLDALSPGEPLPADRERLALAVAAAAPERLGHPAFGHVARYVEDDPGGEKLLALAATLGDLFDQYGVYRPDLVARWVAGRSAPEDDFQAVLLRDAIARTGAPPAAGRLERALATLRAGPSREARARLPERISVFAVTSLPPVYLELFVALGGSLDVHLFALAPSPHRFTDLALRGAGLAAHDAAASPAPPLLAALGKIGRDAHALFERALDDPEGRDVFVRPEGPSVLATLQRDVHDLVVRDARLPFPHGDDSVRVHVCHGPMREVEVLRDELFRRFEEDRSLDPADVVVMCPDVDRYAPYVDAVFGGATDREVPFRIADRREAASQEVFVAFRALVDALGGRLGVSTLLDLLGFGPVRDAFGVDAGELGDVRQLLVEAEARWGVDGEHKTAWGQPPIEAHSLRFALDRLLVGWAAGPAHGDLVLGVAPAEDVEGARADLVGRLAAFVGALAEARSELARPRSVSGHAAALVPYLARWLDARDDRAWQLDRLREVLTTLDEDARTVGFDREVSLAAFLARVDARLESRGGGAFLAGGVTFCELLPMRSIPFRVVALLGMNDGAFPRASRTVAFDVMQRAPRLGDRDVREEDRTLFLECLLAARERLVVTYTGRSPKDGAALAPSVVVGELLDALDATFDGPQGVSDGARPRARDGVVRTHRLQAFAPEVFVEGAAHPSYDRSHAEAARALARGAAAPPPFVGGAVPDPDATAQPRAVTLDELARFLKDPLRDFVLRRLGVPLGDDFEPLHDDDRTDLNALEQFGLGTRVLETVAGGVAGEVAVERALHEGTVPSGPWGRLVGGGLAREMEQLANEAAASDLGPPAAPLPVDLAVGRFRLLGVLRDLRRDGIQVLRPGKMKTHVRLRAWVNLLALAVATGRGDLRARILARSGERELYDLPADPGDVLAQLLELWAAGRAAPQLFFPEAGWVYVGALADPKLATRPVDEREAAARAKASKKFVDGDFSEAAFPHTALVLGGVDPFADDASPFPSLTDARSAPELAEAVLGPLAAARVGDDAAPSAPSKRGRAAAPAAATVVRKARR